MMLPQSLDALAKIAQTNSPMHFSSVLQISFITQDFLTLI